MPNESSQFHDISRRCCHCEWSLHVYGSTAIEKTLGSFPANVPNTTFWPPSFISLPGFLSKPACRSENMHTSRACAFFQRAIISLVMTFLIGGRLLDGRGVRLFLFGFAAERERAAIGSGLLLRVSRETSRCSPASKNNGIEAMA